MIKSIKRDIHFINNNLFTSIGPQWANKNKIFIRLQKVTIDMRNVGIVFECYNIYFIQTDSFILLNNI